MVSDDEMLRLLRENPEKGLKTLAAQYGGLVYAVCRRNLGGASSSDIEDCAAGVFAELYLELDRFDPSKGSVKAWLCTIARHNALDAARKTKETLPLDEEILSTIPDEESSVESELEESELRRAVLDEVKSLPEPDREILLRKFYLGESSKEIAARLKMSVSNVDTRTSRAVEKLRKRLADWR